MKCHALLLGFFWLVSSSHAQDVPRVLHKPYLPQPIYTVPFVPDDLGSIVFPVVSISMDLAIYQVTKGSFSLAMQSGSSNLWHMLSIHPTFGSLATDHKIEFKSADSEIYPNVTLSTIVSGLGGQIKLENGGSFVPNATLNVNVLKTHLASMFAIKPGANPEEISQYHFDKEKSYMRYGRSPVACALYLNFGPGGATIEALVFTYVKPEAGAYYKLLILDNKKLKEARILTEIYES